MAGKAVVNQIQLGDSSTATHNFVWQTNADGSCKLARGNAGATTQDILTVDAAGKVALAGGSNELGVGQTWQDVKTTPGRAVNTTYTNSTGKPIEVMITYYTAANINILVGSVVVAITNGGNTTSTLSFVVPAGSTYKWDSASGNIQVWAELR